MESIKKITSFQIDHTKLEPGFYISRKDGSITTYDLRTRKPNADKYMDNVTMHTVEHLFATYVRNSKIGQNVIYFGPMGCQTGFYLLVDSIDDNVVFETVKDILRLITTHSGEVFGASAVECGNYRTLKLECAKIEAEKYLEVLENISSFQYGG